jgi:hypothetical protein
MEQDPAFESHRVESHRVVFNESRGPDGVLPCSTRVPPARASSVPDYPAAVASPRSAGTTKAPERADQLPDVPCQFQGTAFTRWNEKAGLPRDAIRSQ